MNSSSRGEDKVHREANPTIQHALIGSGDSERLHFAIEVAAFEAESRRRLRHVPAVLLQFPQNEFALVGAARFVQR